MKEMSACGRVVETSWQAYTEGSTDTGNNLVKCFGDYFGIFQLA